MRSLTFLLGFTLLTADPSLCQIFESVGTRATGMAGAFVAVADDGTAAYWNPAGLSTGAFFSLLADHTLVRERVSGVGTEVALADRSNAIVALSTNAFAFSYYRLRINQIGPAVLPSASGDQAQRERERHVALRSWLSHNVAVSAAQVVYPGVSVGTTFRYVRAAAGMVPGDPFLSTEDLLGQVEHLVTQGGNAVDLDLGLVLGTAAVRVGVVARNLLQPTFGAPDGRTLRLDRQIRAGLAMRVLADFLLALDVDVSRQGGLSGHRRNVAVGAERWFGQWLGVRGGGRLNVEADEPMVVGTFGLSLALSSGVYVDAQVTRGRNSVEQGWGLGGRLGF